MYLFKLLLLHSVLEPYFFVECQILVKGKAIDFMSLRTSSGQARQPYEMVASGTILSPSEGGRKPQGENHQALAVKCERYPTCGTELNPGISHSSSQDSNSGATKPH